MHNVFLAFKDTEVNLVSRTKPPEWLNGIVRRAIRANLSVFSDFTGKISIRLVYCDSESIWKRESKYYFVPFARGLVLRDGTVVVKSPALAKVSRKDFEKIVIHEFNHAFWIKRIARKNRLWTPFWLVEALACHVAKNSYLLSPTVLRKRMKKNFLLQKPLPYRYRAGLLTSREDLILSYSLWHLFLVFLLKQGNTKFQRFLRALSRHRSKVAYEGLFPKYYNKSLYLLFAEFIESLPSWPTRL